MYDQATTHDTIGPGCHGEPFCHEVELRHTRIIRTQRHQVSSMVHMPALLAVRHTARIEVALGSHAIAAAISRLVHVKAMRLSGA